MFRSHSPNSNNRSFMGSPLTFRQLPCGYDVTFPPFFPVAAVGNGLLESNHGSDAYHRSVPSGIEDNSFGPDDADEYIARAARMASFRRSRRHPMTTAVMQIAVPPSRSVNTTISHAGRCR